MNDPMSALRVTLWMAVLVGFAGCLGDAPGVGPAPAVSDMVPSVVAPNVSALDGRQTFDVRDAGISLILGQPKLLLLEVDANVTDLVAELRWPDPLDDLDLHVYSPIMCADAPVTGLFVERAVCSWLDWWTFGSGPGSHVVGLEAHPPSGPTYLRLDIPSEILRAESCGEPVCTWRVVVGSELMVDAPFELRATLFSGVPVPQGYSAFEEA